jgi:hypothetical protein
MPQEPKPLQDPPPQPVRDPPEEPLHDPPADPTREPKEPPIGEPTPGPGIDPPLTIPKARRSLAAAVVGHPELQSGLASSLLVRQALLSPWHAVTKEPRL